MNQAVRTRKNFDKGAELDDLAHRAFVNLSDLSLGGDPLHHFDGFLGSRFIDGSDRYRAVICDVHLDAGRFDGAANDLTARTDHLAHLSRLDSEGGDARVED